MRNCSKSVTRQQFGLSDKKPQRGRCVPFLIGLLQHATKMVKSGQTFVARMYTTAARLKELHHVTRLTKDFRSDRWWHPICHQLEWHHNNTCIQDRASIFRQMHLNVGDVEHALIISGYSLLDRMSGKKWVLW